MIEVNDVIQIVPGHKWGGCLAVVREIKSWDGVMAYVEIPLQGPAFIMLTDEEYERIGKAVFSLEIEEEE